MSAEKVAGILGSAVVCVVALLTDEIEFAYASGGLIPLILGLGPVGRGVKTAVGKLVKD